MKNKSLILFILVFILFTFVGIKIKLLGTFLAGAYLSNGIAHFAYGIFGFGKITPKKFFGEEKFAHSIWGLCNFVLVVILVYFSNFKENFLVFVIGILIAILLLPLMAKEG